MKMIAFYCKNTVKYMIRENTDFLLMINVVVHGITTGFLNIDKQQRITYSLNCRQETNNFSCIKP